MEDFIAAGGLSPSWCTLGEDGAEDSGVEISSMSAYGFPPFLLKALLKELRNCGGRQTLELSDELRIQQGVKVSC